MTGKRTTTAQKGPRTAFSEPPLLWISRLATSYAPGLFFGLEIGTS